MRLFITTIIALLITLSSASADYEAGKAAYDAGDYETAYNEWLPLAEAENAKAQNALGILYGQVNFSKNEPLIEEQWYLKAAEQNYSQAQVNLFVHYSGTKAVFWMFVAAMNGHVDALKAFEIYKNEDQAFEQTRYLLKDAKEWLLSRNHSPQELSY